jgi:hypothetical protein
MQSRLKRRPDAALTNGAFYGHFTSKEDAEPDGSRSALVGENVSDETAPAWPP